MHKSLKLVVVVTIIFSFFSFNLKNPSETINRKYTFVQEEITWALLSKIDFVKKPNKLYGEVMFPVINPKLKSLQGKTITITGFIVPIDNKNFAVSKNVFANCFFCGKSGPETIMGIKFKGETPRLRTDQYVTLKGTFRYNDDDVEDWIYHVENAVITEGN